MASAPKLPPPSTDHPREARFQMGDRFIIHAWEKLEKATAYKPYKLGIRLTVRRCNT